MSTHTPKTAPLPPGDRPRLPPTYKQNIGDQPISESLTLRRWYAGQALAGILACPEDYKAAADIYGRGSTQGRVGLAYQYADAMIAFEAKKEEEQ